MIPDHVKQNFETLKRACRSDDLGVMECTEKATGKVVNLICAVSQKDGVYTLHPLARMIDGDPYELYDPPEV